MQKHEYETINNKEYYRFSGRLDTIHLMDDGKALCGKPCLSGNYAYEKPDEKICPKCLAYLSKTRTGRIT